MSTDKQALAENTRVQGEDRPHSWSESGDHCRQCGSTVFGSKCTRLSYPTPANGEAALPASGDVEQHLKVLREMRDSYENNYSVQGKTLDGWRTRLESLDRQRSESEALHREEVDRLKSYDDEVREVLYAGLDRDRDQSTTRTLAIVATNALANEREARIAAEAALGEARELLRQTNALYSERALLANPEATEPMRVGRWIGNVRDLIDRMSKEPRK